MIDIDILNTVIKSLFINIFSFLIFFKINNFEKMDNIKIIKSGLLIVLLTGLYCILKNVSDILSTIIILYFLESMLLSSLTNLKLSRVLISTIISMSISYFLFIFAGTIEFILQAIFNINSKTGNLLLTLAIEYIILFFISRVKRLKKGLSFLQKENEYIDIAIINISAIIILVYGLIGNNFEKIIEHIYFYFVILGTFMFIILQKTLVMYYKQKLLDDTIKGYKKDLEEKEDKLKELATEAFKVSKTSHEFYNRQKALELKVLEADIEAEEKTELLERIRNLTSEYSEALQRIKIKDILPATNIPEIDDIFKYMKTECSNNDIDFKLQIEGNIYFIINNLISKSKLETLIGDHIRDAIIAVNSSQNKYKSIFTILGKKNKYYELCIYDSGIEFEIETLLKLGLEKITTHKNVGGSGIGFLTTFETMKECKASLIIEEKHEVKDNDYTKAVIIRFDNKNEYIIRSYRADEIKNMNVDNRKVIIESI